MPPFSFGGFGKVGGEPKRAKGKGHTAAEKKAHLAEVKDKRKGKMAAKRGSQGIQGKATKVTNPISG